MASWGERLTRISAETTDVKRVVVVVVVVGLSYKAFSLVTLLSWVHMLISKLIYTVIGLVFIGLGFWFGFEIKFSARLGLGLLEDLRLNYA